MSGGIFDHQDWGRRESCFRHLEDDKYPKTHGTAPLRQHEQELSAPKVISAALEAAARASARCVWRLRT